MGAIAWIKMVERSQYTFGPLWSNLEDIFEWCVRLFLSHGILNFCVLILLPWTAKTLLKLFSQHSSTKRLSLFICELQPRAQSVSSWQPQNASRIVADSPHPSCVKQGRLVRIWQAGNCIPAFTPTRSKHGHQITASFSFFGSGKKSKNDRHVKDAIFHDCTS